MTLREWLRANGYDGAAALIDEVMAEWKAAGSKERRDWGLILAGGKEGKSRVVAGREFPVLKAAQIRYKKPITSNALCLNEDEEFPPIAKTGRWPGRKRKKKV